MDDLSAEVARPDCWIEKELGGFILVVIEGFRAYGFVPSGTKSFVAASSDRLGKKMEQIWEGTGIKCVRMVKVLGVGLGAGVRRNADVLRCRLKKMKKRISRFRRLRKIGISTSRLLRTGAKAAMTLGQAIMGVSNSMLRDQRRLATAIVAPASGCGGQNLDIALMLADEHAKAGADPAFDAHLMPIGDWATAVWENWPPAEVLERVTNAAKKTSKSAENTWAVVKCPGAAMAASC